MAVVQTVLNDKEITAHAASFLQDAATGTTTIAIAIAITIIFIITIIIIIIIIIIISTSNTRSIIKTSTTYITAPGLVNRANEISIKSSNQLIR